MAMPKKISYLLFLSVALALLMPGCTNSPLGELGDNVPAPGICKLMKNRDTGAFGCYGCVGAICNEPEGNWQEVEDTEGLCSSTVNGCRMEQ